MCPRIATLSRPYPNLRAWRLSRGWSQVEAAKYLDLSQSAYSRFERGSRFAKGELARRLMDRTGVSLDVLAGVA